MRLCDLVSRFRGDTIPRKARSRPPFPLVVFLLAAWPALLPLGVRGFVLSATAALGAPPTSVPRESRTATRPAETPSAVTKPAQARFLVPGGREVVAGGTVIVLVLLGGSLLSRARRSRKNEKEEALQRAVEQKTRELQEANRLLEVRTQELEALNSRLELLSTQDPLTGAANRRRFGGSLCTEWARAQRHGQQVVLLMADIDHFKAYNDAHGHVRGDECLRRITDILLNHFRRAEDLVARYGGDEFAVLVPETDLAKAEEMADAVRREIEELGLVQGPACSRPMVTLSFGIAAVRPVDGLSPSDLVAMADGALYRAKTLGRDRVVVWGRESLERPAEEEKF